MWQILQTNIGSNSRIGNILGGMKMVFEKWELEILQVWYLACKKDCKNCPLNRLCKRLIEKIRELEVKK